MHSFDSAFRLVQPQLCLALCTQLWLRSPPITLDLEILSCRAMGSVGTIAKQNVTVFWKVQVGEELLRGDNVYSIWTV